MKSVVMRVSNLGQTNRERSSVQRLLGLGKLFVCLVFVQLTLVFPAFAAKAGGGEIPGIGSLLWPSVNFFLYATVIFYAYKRLAAPALKQQRAEIKDQFEKGRAELTDAKRALEWLHTQQEDIEVEKANVVAQLEEEGRLLALGVIEKAQIDSSYSRKDVERRIAGELGRLEAQLRATAVRAAADKARAALRENVDAQRDMRLRRNAISQFRS